MSETPELETSVVPYKPKGRSELISLRDVERMASIVVASGMFPSIRTKESAITLMLLCQSEGLHPMQALMRYNIIAGRPSMKSEAMLAAFMERGGTVDWTEFTDQAVTGVFKSKGCPNGVTVRWTTEDAKRAGTQNMIKFPRQM